MAGGNREYTPGQAMIICGLMLAFIGLLLLHVVLVETPRETIKTEDGFLGLSYSVYRHRRGFDLYVPVGDTEYRLDDGYIERPLGDLERELNRMVTYGAEVTYIERPGMKPHLLGLKVLGEEVISFDEVYANWQKNNRMMEVLCAACTAAGPLLFLLGLRRIKKETGS